MINFWYDIWRNLHSEKISQELELQISYRLVSSFKIKKKKNNDKLSSSCLNTLMKIMNIPIAINDV